MFRYQQELPTVIKSRTEKYITLEELTKIMKWKLMVRIYFSIDLFNFIVSNTRATLSFFLNKNK